MKSRRLFLYIVIIWLIYAALYMFAPVVKDSRFHLSNLDISLIKVSIVAPVLFVWLIACHGARLFSRYTTLLNSSPEAHPMRNISRGLNWAVAYLVALSVPGGLLPFIHDHNLHQIWVAVGAYLPLALALIAFGMLYLGSQQLDRIGKFATWTPPTFGVTIAYLVFCGIFSLSFYNHPTILGSGMSNSITSVLGHGAILFSIILPYLVIWFLGIITAANIINFRRHVAGSIYRLALRNLVTGILGVIGFAVVLQVLDLFSPSFEGLGVGAILLILYGLIILYGFGFVFIASGAKKLIRIEEAA